MEQEQWKVHPDFPYHEISSHGRVRTRVKLGKFGRPAGAILSGTTTRKGYKQVRLTKDDGTNKLYWVHCLVLEAFVGPRPVDRYETRHKDGSKDNNRLNNLEWTTPKENQADRVKHGTSNRGENNPMYKHGAYIGTKK